MQVILGDQQIVFENKLSVIEDILNYVQQHLEKSEEQLSHFIVDGVDVYENQDQYLAEHIDDIQTIEVVCKTVAELVIEILLSTKEYVERALPQIEELADEFYQGPSTKSWDTFRQLLEGIQWLAHMLTSIDQSEYQPSNWNAYIHCWQQLQQQLPEVEDALVQDDTIVVADLLLYEIVPILNKLLNEVKTTLEHEGKHHDLN